MFLRENGIIYVHKELNMDELKLKELLFKVSIISGHSCSESVENIKMILNKYSQNLVFEFCPYIVNIIAEKHNKTFVQLRKEGLPKEFVYDFILGNEDKINEDFLSLKAFVTKFDFSLLEIYGIDILKNATEISLNYTLSNMVKELACVHKNIKC